MKTTPLQFTRYGLAANSILAVSILTVLSACGSSNNENSTPAGDAADNVSSTMSPLLSEVPDPPVFDQANFSDDSALVSNEFFPLSPGTTTTLRGENDDGELETVVTSVSHLTRTVAGVESAIVVDSVYVAGELVEETFDWFAQDIMGNVWYMGEASSDYENGELISTGGSWESNLDVDGVGSTAQAGYQMLAAPVVNTVYKQEHYPGVAEDFAEIVSVDAVVVLNDGSEYTTLKIAESVPFESAVPLEHKYYAPGIGLVLSEKIDGDERVELVDVSDQRAPDITPEQFTSSLDINNRFLPLQAGSSWRYIANTDEGQEEIVVEVLDETRVVSGITTRQVRDRVFLDGLLIEDTIDWFAQDNDGNIWYFGETVVNYEYDDEGNLLSTNDDSSWEAGIDSAQPGIIMLAEPRVGASYWQEFAIGEAEDIGAVVAAVESLTLSDGSMYSALVTQDWNPLEPDSSAALKYYAEGVGLVREQDIGGESVVELVDFTLQ